MVLLDDALTLQTGPTSEPLTDVDVIEHLRLEDDLEANQVDRVIAAARAQVEHLTGRALMPQTWELALRRFPPHRFRLPKPPLVSVTSITYVDDDGNSQVLASSEYQVNIRIEPGEIERAFRGSWPDTRDVPNAVIVQYVVGYGGVAATDTDARASLDELAGDLRAAMLLICGELWENRESSIVGLNYNPTPTVRNLLAPHRVGEWWSL